MEYNPSDLRKLQMLQVGMLKDFDTLCRKHDLAYFIDYGTTIGAVRHQGFIPWDDDVDVSMPRKDYERFLEIAARELPDRYKLYNVFTEKTFVMTFSKICLNDTVFVEAANPNIKYTSGIFLDVFPYDKTSRDEKKRKKQIKKTFIWGRIVVLSEYPVPLMPEGLRGWKRSIAKLGCRCIYGLLHLFGLNKLKAYKRRQKWACMFENEETDVYIDLTPTVGPEKTMIYEKELYPLQDIAFEGLSVKSMHDHDGHMQRVYGDYMQLPPVEQRVNHFPSAFDFGAYEGFSLEKGFIKKQSDN